MFDQILALDVITLIDENLKTVLKRTKHIKSADDFTSSETGMILLDSICMKLVAIGESIKNLDKITNKEFLPRYQQIEWNRQWGCAILLFTIILMSMLNKFLIP